MDKGPDPYRQSIDDDEMNMVPDSVRQSIEDDEIGSDSHRQSNDDDDDQIGPDRYRQSIDDHEIEIVIKVMKDVLKQEKDWKADVLAKEDNVRRAQAAYQQYIDHYLSPVFLRRPGTPSINLDDHVQHLYNVIHGVETPLPDPIGHLPRFEHNALYDRLCSAVAHHVASQLRIDAIRQAYIATCQDFIGEIHRQRDTPPGAPELVLTPTEEQSMALAMMFGRIDRLVDGNQELRNVNGPEVDIPVGEKWNWFELCEDIEYPLRCRMQ